MMKSSKIVYCLILDDKYGKINSHWAYSTEKLRILARVYYDEQGYENLVEEAIKEHKLDFIGFSGRLAIEIAKKLERYFKTKSISLQVKYQNILKVMKFHNTNLSSSIANFQFDKEYFLDKGNDWVRLAIDHPFDLAFVQTYGDAEIINKLNNNNKAVWVPYSYNDKLYYERNQEKKLDIGAFCKIERHSHRVGFISLVEKIANKYGYSFEFSDQYWGEQYAKKISEAKVVVHLSYCGDIPWRLYECAASQTCFLTDRLGFGIGQLFTEGSYVEYNNDFTNLELQIRKVVENEAFRKQVTDLAKQSVRKYAWGEFADNWVVPTICRYLEEKRKQYVLYKTRRSGKKSCERK